MPCLFTSPARRPPEFVLDCSGMGVELLSMDQLAWNIWLDEARALGVQHFEVAGTEAFDERSLLPIKALSHTGELVAISARIGPTPNVLARWLPSWMASSNAKTARRQWHGPSMRRALIRCMRHLGRVQVSALYLHAPPASAFDDAALGESLADMRAAGVFKQLGVFSDDLDLVATALQKPGVDLVQFTVGTEDQTFRLLTLAEAYGKSVALSGLLNDTELAAPCESGQRWPTQAIAAAISHPSVVSLVARAETPRQLRSSLATYMALCEYLTPARVRA